MTIKVQAGRLLGTLRVECAVARETEGAGSRDRADFRPVRTPLLNDGRWRYWMAPGEDYRIGHDGTGWRVTCWTWGDGHTYRLADAGAWELVDRLPLADGQEVTLDPARVYALRHVDLGVWHVLEG